MNILDTIIHFIGQQ